MELKDIQEKLKKANEKINKANQIYIEDLCFILKEIEDRIKEIEKIVAFLEYLSTNERRTKEILKLRTEEFGLASVGYLISDQTIKLIDAINRKGNTNE